MSPRVWHPVRLERCNTRVGVNTGLAQGTHGLTNSAMPCNDTKTRLSVMHSTKVDETRRARRHLDCRWPSSLVDSHFGIWPCDVVRAGERGSDAQIDILLAEN